VNLHLGGYDGVSLISGTGVGPEVGAQGIELRAGGAVTNAAAGSITGYGFAS
jgi:hypothetical protein